MLNFNSLRVVISFVAIFSIINLYAGEDSLYDFKWLDPDKKVYVLQNKIYEKKNSFYANIGYGFATSTDFQSTKNIQLKLGYFFAEEWGIEAIYTSISNSDNETMENLSFASSTTPFIRRYNSYMGVMAIFSPFYGKINTFNKIYYFDLNVGLGLAKVSGESNRIAFQASNPAGVKTFTSESYTGLIYKISARGYITKHWNVDLSFITNMFKADSAKTVGKKTWYENQDLILAVGYSL